MNGLVSTEWKTVNEKDAKRNASREILVNILDLIGAKNE
jgi:hypothetical protein